ncbi:halocyanin domain-containing protein [Halorarius litoreus]|uniref:halocyanin domain-containing protein n=1 Tax=Halorarius litoreus TaxID=2962676 RepID=UPI0020CF7A1D|nr:halocyanin domain-containing protein [Halorarius litoreus]
MDRRSFLGAAAGITTVGAGCIGGGGNEGYGNWFSDVENYDGETDRTGRSEVTVRVGAEDGLKFSPPAIVVDQGTLVRWTWTGQGGRHNVVERDDRFRSEYHDSEGSTFERTFEKTGVFPYYCEPHRTLGMKGGVRVE